ncbi:UvrD-helicase domain-containing protein [Aeoliella sp. ICT_H6.2]|uniref:DNA 3'-5' helicase n=1 Tax=Aeoliella straminimaris TaxID=2954799 RepID=A0A9X2FHH0_9BACT|nr:UvrD-helicase domain-containing protein [Aeoliella straminimaris]MCO6044896.1 UvrD-helicase domain-containing protein [Aeoliella straminimaris]
MPAEIQYTEQQARAIEAHEVSLSLDAGAGCGKTFVLTERYLKELERHNHHEPATRLNELVAITFTDAAARELRTRIRRLVYDRIAQTAGDERGRWLELQRAIDGCRISTIHSLCGNLLRQHAFDVGLDPLFATLDGPAAAVLEAESIEDTLRKLLTDRDADAMAIGRAWNVDGAKDRVRRMASYYRKPGFREWLERSPEELLAAWGAYYSEELWTPHLSELRPMAEALLDLLATISPETAEHSATLDTIFTGLNGVVDGSVDPPQLIAARKGLVANRKPFSKSCWNSESDFEQFKHWAVTFRQRVDGFPTLDLKSPAAHEAAELGLALARVAAKAARAYEEVKREHGAVDFEDLLALTHRLLTDPKHREVQRQLQAGISVLFVDEFQDTDRIQVDMVRSLVGDIAGMGKLFFVGDDKQSIYRFRGAEPRVFRDLQGEIDQAWRLPLSQNFRSQPAILNFVNTLFGQVFEPYQALEPSRPQTTAEPAIELLWTDFPRPESGSQAGHAAHSRKAEARAVAARLRTLVDTQAPIVGDKTAADGRRAAEYGDIAILFRSLSDIAAYEEALRAEDIPYYLVGGHAFYTQQEIYDVLHLLRVVLSECDELSLAGVLRSPFFAVADESLFWLIQKGGSLERGLFGGLLPSEIEGDERDKVLHAAETLSLLRAKKDEWTVPQILAEAMERTSYDAALLADFMGERKLANVYKLMEQARAAVASGVGSLSDFVTQLAEFTTATPKEALATTSPGNANVVRLMTVHKSKGLEFPVVVVPDLNRKANAGGDQVAYNERLGPLVGTSGLSDDSRSATTGLKLFQHVDRQDDAAETDRLFYVACTRAADYLMLSSAIEDIEQPKGPWLKRLSEVFELETGDLIDPSIASEDKRPRVAASLTKAPAARPFSSGSSVDWLKIVEKAKRQKPNPAIEHSAQRLAVSPTARRRYSVTRLSGQIIPSGAEWWRDDEVEADEIATTDYDPLGFGTLVHAVLERCDLSEPSTIAQWSQLLAPHHDVLHVDTVATMATDMVERFATTSRASELAGAPEVHHEVEFTLTWPLGSTNADDRYLQGYLDCLYQAADGAWRVLDYKTNQVSAAGVEELATKYELQMLVYGLAVEQTWGKSPTELVLHFLRPGVEYAFKWNAAARDRAIELVESALAKLESAAAR